MWEIITRYGYSIANYFIFTDIAVKLRAIFPILKEDACRIQAPRLADGLSMGVSNLNSGWIYPPNSHRYHYDLNYTLHSGRQSCQVGVRRGNIFMPISECCKRFQRVKSKVSRYKYATQSANSTAA